MYQSSTKYADDNHEHHERSKDSHLKKDGGAHPEILKETSLRDTKILIFGRPRLKSLH